MNVLTGQPFGAEEKAPALELNKLFSVDTDWFAAGIPVQPQCTGFCPVCLILTAAHSDGRTGGFQLAAAGLQPAAGLDPDTIGALMESLSLSIPAEKVQALAQKVLNGYKDYVIGNGFLHLNRLRLAPTCRRLSSSS